MTLRTLSASFAILSATASVAIAQTKPATDAPATAPAATMPAGRMPAEKMPAATMQAAKPEPAISTSAPAGAKDGQLGAMVAKIKPSLVVVRYTYEGEVGRRDLDGLGIVVSDDGLVIISLALTPPQLADEQLKDFKIVIPGEDEQEIDAEFLGRDERTLLSFVKAKSGAKGADRTWTPLKFVDKKVGYGDEVVSIGLLPKAGGYGPYVSKSMVSAILRGPFPQVMCDKDGLTVTGSPVFNAQGDAIGYVNPLSDSTPLLNDPRNDMASVESPPRIFVPASDFLPGLMDPPTEGKPVTIPTIGIAQPTGLKKDVAEYYELGTKPAVQIGDVIPGFPADKAGLKARDVIVQMNGEPLERGDQPEETPQILMRKISRMKPGDVVTLGVLPGPGEPLKDVKVTLEARPEQASKGPRFYAEDLGYTTRDVVFDDTYARKLPKETKGAVVTFVRPQSAAQTASLLPNDLVTKLNQTPVENVKQFKEQYEAFRKEKPNEAVVMEVLRGPSTQIIRIEPPQE